MRTRRRPAGWFGGQWPEMHNNQPPVAGYADENPAPARRMVRGANGRKCTKVAARPQDTLVGTQ